MKKILSLVCLSFTSLFSFAQFLSTPPVQNGSISGTEYGNSNNPGPWYIGWDSTNLYIGLTAGQNNEPAIMYFDINPTGYNSGGVATGTNGSTTGTTDWGITPNLPFVAKARLYFQTNTPEGNYAEVALNTGSGWGAPVVISFQLNTFGFPGSNNFELFVKWAQLGAAGGLPSAFNWLATESSTAGYIYSQFPTTNYFGDVSTTPTYHYYQSVVNTGSPAIDALSDNLRSFTNYNDSSFYYINTLPTTLYDFTLGKSNDTDSCKVFVQTPIIITHNLVITHN